MTYEMLKTFFMWTTIFHYSILIFWVVFMKFGGSLFRRQQTYWFPVPQEHFMSLQYLMYGIYKLMALIFSAIPYIVLVIIGN